MSFKAPLLLTLGLLCGIAAQDFFGFYSSPVLANSVEDTNIEERVVSSYKGVPSDIFDVMNKGLSLGVFSDYDQRMLAWYHDTFPAGHGERWLHEEMLRRRLDKHLNIQVHPWVLQKEQKTGFYSFEDETNEYLGPEMARWCEPKDGDCTPPLSVSVLCDMSQSVSCRTIAQAVRMSEHLFLLYPYSSTESQQTTYPEVTLLYGRFPGRGHGHKLYAINSVDVSEEVMVFDFSVNNSQYSMDMERPNDILSTPLTDVEQAIFGIHNLLGIRTKP